MFLRTARVSAFTFGICLVLAGCDNSGVVPVSGTLTYKGKPVTNAFINFVPETGRPSMGETDKDGNFTLVYDPQIKGAQIGKHKVFVTHNPAADASVPGTIPGEPAKLSPESREVFSKYNNEKSKIEVTIEKATKDLKLNWD